jgi:hypothetical protein
MLSILISFAIGGIGGVAILCLPAALARWRLRRKLKKIKSKL